MPTAHVLASDLVAKARRRPGVVAMRTVGEGAYGVSMLPCTGAQHGGKPHEHWTFSSKGVSDDDPFRQQVVASLKIPADAESPKAGYLQWVVFPPEAS